MAKFLNTKSSIHWISEVIKKAKREVVIIVPYIKTSSEMYAALKSASERGISIFIIYREKALYPQEKQKLLNLANVSLLHHPNVHCKCYFNGERIIISSMNLYEYSEKNNREMGIMLVNNNMEVEKKSKIDDHEIFEDAIDEMRQIINGCTIEKLNKAEKGKLEIEILKTKEELAAEWSTELTDFFVTKTFKPFQTSRGEWCTKCDNYFDNIDVTFEERRTTLKINKPEEVLMQKHNEFMKSYQEYEMKGFKYYWNWYKNDIFIYPDSNFPWDKIEDPKIRLQKWKQGIDTLISKYRKLK